MKNTLFQNGLVVYSDILNLKLNFELLDKAQAEIFQKGGMADNKPLSTEEIVNSILNSVTLPNSQSETELVKGQIYEAMNLSLGIGKRRCPPIRLTKQNFDKVRKLVAILEPIMEVKKRFSLIIGEGLPKVESHEDIDEEMGKTINAILLFYLTQRGIVNVVKR